MTDYGFVELYPLASFSNEHANVSASIYQSGLTIQYALSRTLAHRMAGCPDVPTVERIQTIAHDLEGSSPTPHEIRCIAEAINQMDHHEMLGATIELEITPRQMAALMHRVNVLAPIPIYWINQFSTRWNLSNDKLAVNRLLATINLN